MAEFGLRMDLLAVERERDQLRADLDAAQQEVRDLRGALLDAQAQLAEERKQASYTIEALHDSAIKLEAAEAACAAMRQALNYVAGVRAGIEPAPCGWCAQYGGTHTTDCYVGKALATDAGRAILDELNALKAKLGRTENALDAYAREVAAYRSGQDTADELTALRRVAKICDHCEGRGSVPSGYKAEHPAASCPTCNGLGATVK